MKRTGNTLWQLHGRKYKKETFETSNEAVGWNI